MSRKDVFPIADPDMIQSVKSLSDEDVRKMSEFKDSDKYNEIVNPIKEEIRSRKHRRKVNYLKDHWIELAALFFAFIAALPIIINAISSLIK